MKTTLALLLTLAIGAILAIGAFTARGRSGEEDASPRSATATFSGSSAEEPAPAPGGGGTGSGSPSSAVLARGIHARAGVECADCHVAGFAPDLLAADGPNAPDPSSPLDIAARACAPCHGSNVNLVVAEARATQDRTRTLIERTESAIAAFNAAAREGEMRAGGQTARLAEARALGARAQAALVLVRGDGSLGVHAPQEVARLLAEAIDDARLAQAKVVAAGGGGGGVGARRAVTRDSASRRGTDADSAPADSAKPAFELPVVTP